MRQIKDDGNKDEIEGSKDRWTSFCINDMVLKAGQGLSSYFTLDAKPVSDNTGKDSWK